MLDRGVGVYLIRKMERRDLEGVLSVQKATFTQDLLESLLVFENRLARFGEFFLVVEIDAQIVGYAMSFPWKLGTTPVNNECFPEVLQTPDCFFLHDITLLESCRGKGIAREMISKISSYSRELGFHSISLVSVAQSGDYWDQLGFKEIEIPIDKKNSILKSYGAGARLMTIG